MTYATRVTLTVVLWNITCVAIGQHGANTEHSLIGSWQSDSARTMDFNEKYAKLSEKQAQALSEIFGKNSLDFSDSVCTIVCPSVSINDVDGAITLEKSVEKLSYRVLGSTPTAIAIITEDSEGTKSLAIWHFDGDYAWIYVGDSLEGMPHVREYFRRVK
jgi:hypothetical protein